MIEKYLKEDGWYKYPNEDGCDYETAESLIQTGVLEFCGCGREEDNLRFVLGGLEIIDEYATGTPFKEWKKKAIEHFGNELSAQFFYYWADKEEYSEHGSCIPGWLTNKGKDLLSDIRLVVNKYMTQDIDHALTTKKAPF
jgi:hypothetical protein